MKEEYASHPRTLTALARLFGAWLAMNDDDKLKACGSDQRVHEVAAEEITNLGCPASLADLKGWVDSQRSAMADGAAGHLGHVLEYSKMCLGLFPDAVAGANLGQLAVASLEATPIEGLRVQYAVALHQSLAEKVKDQANADAFKAKAKEVFPHSSYFRQ